jgi:hypothetical protein
MFTNMFSYDVIAARTCTASQLANAGYENKTQTTHRQSIDLSPLFVKISDALASLFRRDEPAALAYEANQLAAAGYQADACNDAKVAGLFDNVTVFIMSRAARRNAAPCLAHSVTP